MGAAPDSGGNDFMNAYSFPLRDLPDGPIVRNEGLPSCSFFCEVAEQEYSA